MKLSKQLKEWRKGAKHNFPYTQAAAAEVLGVPLRTYQQWEQGRQAPRGIALKAVLERIK